jgi:hypothetical protein
MNIQDRRHSELQRRFELAPEEEAVRQYRDVASELARQRRLNCVFVGPDSLSSREFPETEGRVKANCLRISDSRAFTPARQLEIIGP